MLDFIRAGGSRRHRHQKMYILMLNSHVKIQHMKVHSHHLTASLENVHLIMLG